MASSSDEESGPDAGETWDDFDGSGAEEEEQATRCLFSDDVLASPAAALTRAVEAYGFDFLALRKELSLDFYDCIRVINFVRTQVASARATNAAALSEAQAARPFVAELRAAIAANKWRDDAFLTPVLDNDPLLFGLDVEDADFGDTLADADGVPPAAAGATAVGVDAAVSALLAENESLKLQLLELMSRLEDAPAPAPAAPDSVVEQANAAVVAAAPAAAADSGASPTGLRVDRGIARRAAAEHVRTVDASYFESYSYFDIHRDMLGDAPRTSAYRDALERNPKLLSGANVLDVGCGTGILSLFAARGGAAAVVGVDGSDRMAAMAAALAADNGLGRAAGAADDASARVRTVAGKLEDLAALPLPQFDVIVSEWMGYCLLFESMLDTVLNARDRFLKPGGAVLPDIATMHLAGFSRAAVGAPFWDDVYGFNFSRVGREVRAETLSSRAARVIPVESASVITSSAEFKRFDLTTMAASDVEFTSDFVLHPNADAGTVDCYGVVVWFDTEFSSRFCAEAPVVLSTSPHAPATHWAQTLFYFKEPITLSSSAASTDAAGSVGTAARPAAQVSGRISIVRSARHRSMDVSVEYEPRAADGVAQPALRQIMLYEV